MNLTDYQKAWDNFSIDLYLAYLEAKAHKAETNLINLN